MRGKTKQFIIRYLRILLMDIGFLVFWKVCAKLSNQISFFAALGYLTIFIYPVVRGVISRILTKCIVLPNLWFFVEYLALSMIIQGELPDFNYLKRPLFLAVFFIIPVIASLITAGTTSFVRSINNTKE